MIEIPKITHNWQLPDMKTYPVDFEQRSTGFNFFYHTDEDPENLEGVIGIELEMRFSAHMVHLRQIAKTFKEQFPKARLTYTDDLQMLFRSKVLGGHFLVKGSPHGDGGGTESVLHPCTFQAHKVLKEEYARILDLYRQFGFNPNQGGDGIHHYIDYKLFGDNQLDESMMLFLWFLFKNADFVCLLSHRQYNLSSVADMYSLLGNTLGNWTDEEFEAAFIRQKDAVLNYLRGDRQSWLRAFNISFGRDGRPACEFRWFGSTWDIDIFMMMIEFSHAIARFVATHRSLKEMELEVFCTYVRNNIEMYPHLIEELFNNEVSAPHMASTMAPEVISINTNTTPSRRVVMF